MKPGPAVSIQQERCTELANTSAFYRNIYLELEEVGWEHLVRLGGDLTFLSFRILDKKGRVHVLEIQLDKKYPNDPPMVSADVPHMFNLRWSTCSRLKDIVKQFQEHLEKHQEFWSTLDEIDESLPVVDRKQPSRAFPCRKIQIENSCYIMCLINVDDPRSLPECRFMGSDIVVDLLRKKWQRNSKKWKKENQFLENIAGIFEIQLPKKQDVLTNDQQTDCGICYSQYLPIDDELGDKSGSGTDYNCENTNCRRAFHSTCLVDWLRSITTTRQYVPYIAYLYVCRTIKIYGFLGCFPWDYHIATISLFLRSFNVLFGNCPYCSEPVAAKIINAKK